MKTNLFNNKHQDLYLVDNTRAYEKNKRMARLAGKQRDKNARLEMQIAKRERSTKGELAWA